MTRPLTALSVSLVVLTLAAGCGGGGGSGGGGGGPTPMQSGDVTLSATVAEPAQAFELRHGSIVAGQTVEVEFDVAGFEYVLPFTALRDGAIRVAVPPVLDADTGQPATGTATLSLVGVESSATISIGAMRVVDQSMGAGDACAIVIERALENFAQARADLAVLRDENAGLDVSDSLAEIDANTARLTAIRDEIAMTGRLDIELADGSVVELGTQDLQLADRWIATWLANYVREDEAGTAPGTLPLSTDKPSLTHEQIRELVRRVQTQAGRPDLRSRENEEALAGVVVGAGGALSGPIGVAANAFSAAVSAGQIVVAFHGSEITLRLTSNSLNGDRVRNDQLTTTTVGIAGIGLATVSILGAYFGSVVVVPLVSVVALAGAIGSALGTVNSSGDINIHVPDRFVEFSELRVQQVGSFSFPLIKTTLLDPGPPSSPSNVYSLSFYGLQDFGGSVLAVSGLWSASNIGTAVSRATYGDPNQGEVNTARGIQGNPGFPAPDLAGVPLFGIIATGGRDTDFGNPGNPTSQRGLVDIKYTDGPVVFTFRISPNVVNLQTTFLTEPVTIEGTISNGSSIPLTVYGLEFELVPGEQAFEPIFDGPGALVSVPSGGQESFVLDNVRIDILNSSWIDNPQQPRLVISNGAAGFDLVQQFWSRLRSVQSLTGTFTITD